MPSIVKRIVDEAPSWFRETSIGRAVIAEQRKQELAARRPLVEQRDRLQRELAQVTAAFPAVEGPLMKAAADARAKVATADGKLAEARRRQAASLHDVTFKLTRCENALRASADERIDHALLEIGRRYDRARGGLLRVREVPTGRLDSGMRPVFDSVDNAAAIKRLLSAMQVARGALESLKLGGPADVDAAIAGILAPLEAAWAAVSTDDDGPRAA